MLHPALVNYKNLTPCGPGDADRLHRARISDEKGARLREAYRRRTARLRCPDCGDRLKVRVLGKWLCRHCLAPMRDPLVV